ncbi:MAG: alpha/beta hydrolase [Nitrospinota bacterium]
MANATVNGVNLNYQVQGKGPPLVLMHGFSTGLYVWDQVAEWLSGEFQVFRHDHRGHGGSEKPPGPYRIQDYVDDLAALLNYLGLDRVDLAGHSMGGRTALLFALDDPGRLNRLLLVGASGAAPEGEPARRFEALKKLASGEGMAAVFESDLFAFALPEAWKKDPEPARERFMRTTPESFCAAADAVLTMPDLRGRLGEIPVPVWACTGESDAGPMAFNELCEENIEACSRAVIPGCGHYPMLDAAEEFIGQLEKFLGASQGGASPGGASPEDP